MAQKQSTALCNYLLAQGSLKAAFPDMRIRIFSGAVPAKADDGIGAAQMLNEVRYAGGDLTFDAAAINGMLLKNTAEAWVGTNTLGGIASFYRVVNLADTNAADVSPWAFCRIQGTIGMGRG